MGLKNKNIMVLGGAGFIGSALARGLLKKSANVVVYDNFSFGHISNLAEIEDKIKIVKADILDYSKLLGIVRKNNIEFICHLVADPFVPNSYRHPDRVFNLITQGTQNVLNACKESEIKKIIYFSSAEIYGNYKYLPIDESHPANPLSVYAAAKLAADNMCCLYPYKNGTSVTTLRLFNAFGPRETHPYIIPELISQLSRSNIARLGNIKSRRSFLFVNDVVDGTIKLLESNNKSKNAIFNLGSDKSYSIEELVHIVGEMLGRKNIKVIIDKKRKRHLDPKILECNYKKVKILVGWKPKTDFESGLKNTISWFLENGRKWGWEKTYDRFY